jgi:hypothetical protein
MNAVERQFLPLTARPWLWLLVALSLTLLMPTNDSIWIDEAQTAGYATEPTFHTWLNRLKNEAGSEAQMPLGMAVAWVSGKIFGTAEWQLRSINVLWACATVFIFWLIGCRFQAPALALVAAVDPFVWFYTNEARPYALQIAAGACLLLAMFELMGGERKRAAWVWLWSLAAIFLAASTMLGVIAVAVVSGWIALTLFRERARLRAIEVVVVFGTMTLLMTVGFYYLGTLRRGAGGAKLWPVGFGNLAFSAYEILGFAGLGPMRQELRDAVSRGFVAELMRPYLLLLISFAAVTAATASQSVRWYLQTGRRGLGAMLFGVPVASAFVLFVAAKAVQFPFWGRHLAPIVPFILVAIGLPALLSTSRFGKVACSLWLSLCLTSSLELRFALRHKKDDNRSAAVLAKSVLAEGKTVWWSADLRSAEYYGIDFAASTDGPGVVFLPATPPEALQALAPPDLVIVSKPQIFDPNGGVAEYLAHSGYKQRYSFQAVTGWVRP